MSKKRVIRNESGDAAGEKSRKPNRSSIESAKNDNARSVKIGTSSEKNGNGKKITTKKSTGRRARKPKKRTDGAGVTENAPYSDLAEYRMVTTRDDVVNSSGS